MTKAEERALERLPKSNDTDTITENRNERRRQIFIQGYEQAEKDLALTWEDILIIHKCIKDAMNYKLYKMMEGTEGQKEVYQEVLKRFNEQRK